MSESAGNMVVVSYWAERSPAQLFSLMWQMRRYDAGAPFSVSIVCNGGDEKPLQLPSSLLGRNVFVFNRVNSGFNIGAWEHGWRHQADHQNFLFLQDECFIRRSGWLRGFIDAMDGGDGVGLVGEAMNRKWDRLWEELRSGKHNDFMRGHVMMDQPARRVDLYERFLEMHDVPAGEGGAHLQALVLFTSRRILQEVGGFPLGESYGEAVAAEIAFSKKIEAAGYGIALVGPRPYYCIGHRQWTRSRFQRLRRKLGRSIAEIVEKA